MSLVRLELPMIFYAYDSQNISTFHRQSQFDGEMIFFCTWRAAFRKWFFGFPAVFHSCGTHFPIFWIFPMDFKRMETASRVTFNWSASCCWVWASSSSNNACSNNSVFELFRWFSMFFVSHVKIVTFEFFKPLKALWFIKSKLIISFDKYSILQQFSSNGNRKSMPQIVVSMHKIRHVQRYYELYCCMKFVLLWVENLCQMSEQGNGVNDAVWRQLHWQL